MYICIYKILTALLAVGVFATAIALGFCHTCTIDAVGGVKCWGWNGYGQLGIGSTSNQTSPVAVPGAGGVQVGELAVVY